MSEKGGAPRLVALQNRDFRLLWFGQLVSSVGSEMQFTAVNWHIYDLLKGTSFSLSLFGHTLGLDARALGLGTLGLVRIIPIILFALVGGMLADTRDRRQLMIWTRTASAIVVGILAALTLSGRASVPVIYLLTGAGAAANALDGPARQSIVPNLVPREHLTNAISLNTLLWEIAAILGPTVAGGMLALFNIGFVYLIDAVSLVVIIVALLLMRYRGRAAAADTGIGWAPMIEGLRFTYGSRIIWSTMLLDFFATFFSSARTMLPIVANDMLHAGVQGYAVLSTAQSVGAVLAGSALSLRRDIRRQGIVLVVSVALYGLATALFGLSTAFALSYLFLALTGAADTVSTVIRGTVRQLMTPDHLRGRMTSVNMIFFMGGPQLGELEAGLVAAALGVSFSIVSGGIATVLLTGWIALKYPRLVNYTSETQAEAVPAPNEMRPGTEKAGAPGD